MIRTTLLATGCVAALALAALPTSASDESVVPPTQQQQQTLGKAQHSPTGAMGDVQCGMPASPHQKQVLSEAQPMQSQTMQPESAFPATPHQQQVLKGKPADGQDIPVPTENGMPISPHQQQVLKSDKMHPGDTC